MQSVVEPCQLPLRCACHTVCVQCGDYQAANQFCSENFLSKPSLMQVQRLRSHLSQALYHEGVTAVSAGGGAGNMEPGRKMNLTIPPELNTNAVSFLLLAALIAIGSQPNFAIRTSYGSHGGCYLLCIRYDADGPHRRSSFIPLV